MTIILNTFFRSQFQKTCLVSGPYSIASQVSARPWPLPIRENRVCRPVANAFVDGRLRLRVDSVYDSAG